MHGQCYPDVCCANAVSVKKVCAVHASDGKDSSSMTNVVCFKCHKKRPSNAGVLWDAQCDQDALWCAIIVRRLDTLGQIVHIS